jgi:alkanesulfonate monooxygenase SsuD/methylene tetrahydromethanopterin reductase-like flavin-dependent oxidoreductase (luciferase family)
VVSAIRFCAWSDVERIEAELCTKTGIALQTLADCPYVFVGPPERMREQLAERAGRLALQHLIVAPVDYETLARFRHDVVASVAA